jgi:hypothetical protein
MVNLLNSELNTYQKGVLAATNDGLTYITIFSTVLTIVE